MVNRRQFLKSFCRVTALGGASLYLPKAFCQPGYNPHRRLYFQPVAATYPAPNVLWWTMSEGSGTSLTDSTGNGYTGTLSGSTKPTWSSSNNPGSNFTNNLSFNGSTAYVATSGPLTQLEGGSYCTLNMWMYRSSSSTNVEGGIYKQPYGFEILIYGTGTTLYADMGNGTNMSGQVNSYTTTGWHMYTMVFDGTQGTNATKLKLYVDAVQQTLQSLGTPPTTLASSANMPAFRLGADNTGSSDRFWGGSIANCNVWSSPLTQAQITALYNAKTP